MYINSSLFTVQKTLHSYKNNTVPLYKYIPTNGCEVIVQFVERIQEYDLTDKSRFKSDIC